MAGVPADRPARSMATGGMTFLGSRGPAYGGTVQAWASASMRPIDWMYARSRADARGQPA